MSEILPRKYTFSLYLVALMVVCVPSAWAAEREVKATVGVKHEYTDNLFWSSDDEESDNITTVSPGLEANYNTERLKSEAKITIHGLLYHDNDDLNTIDQEYQANMRYGLTERANMFTSARYRRDSRSDTDFTETGQVVDNVDRDRYTFMAGGDYALSEVMRTQLSYTFDGEYYSDSDYSDYASHNVGLQFDRNLSAWLANTTGRLNFGFGYFDLDTGEVTTWSATVGGERKIDERYSFFADLGLIYVDSSFDAVRLVPSGIPGLYLVETYEDGNSGVGVIGKAGIKYRGELIDGQFFASRSVSPSSGQDGTVARTLFQGELGRRLNEKSRISFAAGYVINKAEENRLSASEVDERSFWLWPALSYSLTDTVQLKLSYSYDYIDDREEESTTYRNLVMAQLVYTHTVFE